MEDLFKKYNNFKKHVDVKSALVCGNLTNADPEITIAIPTYKRPDMLKHALDSALLQICKCEYEVIVVDNEASAEETETEKLIKSYNDSKILYYRNEENIGMFGNWNRCIELARGKWITILNDDDWLNTNYLNETYNFLLKKKVDIILVGYKIHDLREKEAIIKIKQSIKDTFKYITSIYKYRRLRWIDFFISPQTAGSLGVLFNKEIAQRYGGFNSKYYPASDYYFIANIAINNNAYVLNKRLANYRILHNESLSVAGKFPNCNLNFRKYYLNKFTSKTTKYILNIFSNSLYRIQKKSVYEFLKINTYENKIQLNIFDKFLSFFLKLKNLIF